MIYAKTKSIVRLLQIFLVAVFLAVSFSACPNPASSSSAAAAASSANTGSLSVSVPSVASWIANLEASKAKKSSTTKGVKAAKVASAVRSATAPKSEASSKALAYLSGVVISVENSSGTIVGSTTINPTSSSTGVVSNLAPGTYTVLVADYNSAVSATAPVVSGSAPVTITAGKQASVNVTCTPATSSLLQTLSFSGASAQANLSLAVSGEQWYKLSLTGGTTYYFTQTNDNFAFCLWSGDGTTNLGSGTSYISYTSTSTGTYYLVVTSLYSTSTDSTTVTVSTTAPVTSEGTISAPISLAVDNSHAFVIPSSSHSFYSFKTGSAGTYALELSAADQINYRVYSDNAFRTPASIPNWNGSFSEGQLLSGLAAGTTYYIVLQDEDGEPLLATGRVASPSTIAGYTSQNVGSTSSPASLTPNTARNDSVGYHYYDSISYYTFKTGSGLDYTLSLAGATGYIDAVIYSDAAFSNEVGQDDFNASPSVNGSGQVLLAPNTTYYIAVENDGADGESALTATYNYTLELSAASVPSFTTLTPFTWASGSNSSSSSNVWYSASVNADDTYMLKCNDAGNDSSSYTATVSIDAYKANRYTSYFLGCGSSNLSSNTFTIPSGQSTMYFCVHNCSGTYALELIDVSTTGTISITAK